MNATPTSGAPVPVAGVLRPFRDHVVYVVDPRTGCWLWQGARTTAGYAQRWVGGRHVTSVHRTLYEAAHGTLAPGLQLDHLCRVRHCINAAHLEPVTHTENVRRGDVCKLRLTAPELLSVIRSVHGNKSKAARVLGVHRTTLYRAMWRVGLEAA